MSTTPSNRRRRLIAPIALTVAATATLSMVASGAWFTDTDSIGANAFTTGTVDLTSTATGGSFAVTNMAPGDVVYKEVTVANPGSLALRYAVTSAVVAGDATLAATLDRAVKVGAATCDAAGYAAATTVAANSAKLNVAAVFGNPDAAQTGTVGAVGADRVLAAGASEKLCFQVSLPTTATNTVATKTISNVTFTFDAVQTKNN